MTKQEQRNRIRELRAHLNKEETETISRNICKTLISLPEVQAAKTVFSYLPLPGEVDLSTVHDYLLSRGAQIAYPVVLGRGYMQAYFPKTDSAFRTGAMGIREPIPEEGTLAVPENADLIFVPCVGFDAGCSRLGHGAGYYDRFLPRCKSAVLISPAFEFQHLDQVATDENDVPVDIIVTEQGIYRKSEG